MHTLFIHWNPDQIAITFGSIGIRWYSLCWVLALLSAYLIVRRLYREQKLGDERFEPLFFYCFLGILVGARLGHCLFYEPAYFLTHPIEMLLPIRQTSEGWHFTGYEGLASHGGTLGLMLALIVYNKRYKVGIWTILDNIAIATPIAAFWIRIGNLMNSEIIGRPTDVPWAFIFERIDLQPRHPGQLYEALVYLALFFIGLAIHYSRRWTITRVGSGWFFGWCIFTIFCSRIFIECVKENQEAFEQSLMLNMGQLLSLPFIALGAYCMYRAARHLDSRF